MPTFSANFYVLIEAVFFSTSVWTLIKIAPSQDHLLLTGALDTAVVAPLGRFEIVKRSHWP